MGKIHKHGNNYHRTAIKNIYRAFLQREADDDAWAYMNHPHEFILDSVKGSHEYSGLVQAKRNIVQAPLDKTVGYTVIKIDDRATTSLTDLHVKMASAFAYRDDITFFDGRVNDVNEFFKSRDININWCADLFGLNPHTTPTELAVAASHILGMEYILNNNIDELIVFEDDVELHNNAAKILSNCLADTPQDYDFLADSSYEPHYEELSTEDRPIGIESKYVCKSYLQDAHSGFMLYSRQGAKNIIDYYKKFGVMCAIDTFLFWLSRRGSLNGYTTYHSNRIIYSKDFLGTLVVRAKA